MNKPSAHKNLSFHLGRLRVNINVWIHYYPDTPDRWVLAPMIIWDRKKK